MQSLYTRPTRRLMYMVIQTVLSLLVLATCLALVKAIIGPAPTTKHVRNIYARGMQVTSRRSASLPRQIDGAAFAIGHWAMVPYLWYRYGGRVALILAGVPFFAGVAWAIFVPLAISDLEARGLGGASFFVVALARGLVAALIVFRGGLWEMRALRAREWVYEGNARGTSNKSAIQFWVAGRAASERAEREEYE